MRVGIINHGRKRGGPSFDNESINLEREIYIYIYSTYPFSRKYFSRRGTRKDSILSNIFFQRPFFFFLLNSVVSSFHSTIIWERREEERERERDYWRWRNGGLFRTRIRNAVLDRANEGSWVVFEIESGSAWLGPTPNLLLVYRNSIRC